jgi:rare lipoprotein A
MTPAVARLAAALACATITAMAGCASNAPSPTRSTGAPPLRPELIPDAIPRAEPRADYGNGPVYEVFGERYRVLDTSYGYVERGVASWYGRKFHGRLTSSREPYDMYLMTAAHKSLPLPTYVEVRNLANDRRIVVRVNDRGPFVKNRIIDLSYSAAHKLGMVEAGTAMVEVRAISFDKPPPALDVVADEPAGEPETAAAPISAAVPAQEIAEPPAPPSAPAEASEPARKIYVQVGAFGERGNAERRHRLLSDNGISPAFVHREADRDPALYRVRVGPLNGVDQYDRVVDELSRLGIDNSHLVTE